MIENSQRDINIAFVNELAKIFNLMGIDTYAVLEAAGVSDILTKSLGSSNVLNVVYATMDALDQLRTPEEVARLRGKSVKEVTPFWDRRKQNA